MGHGRRQFLTTLCGAGTAAALPVLARPAAYPDEVVAVVVPFSAGGSTDYLARLFAAELGRRLGGRFVVENRPGAGGIIGTRQVAAAAPDGLTLLYTTATPLSINPFAYRSLPYDPQQSFEPIALTASLPLVLVVSRQHGPGSLDALFELLRRAPGRCSYGSYGHGTSSHVACALLTKLIGAAGVVHVPYRDTRLLAELAEGITTFQIDAWSVVAPLVRSGRLSVLATCGADPLPPLPPLPSVEETIGQEFRVATWHGLLAPARTPGALLDLLHRQIGATLADREIRRELLAQGFTPQAALSRAEVAAFIAADRGRWKRYIETAEIPAL